MQTKSSLLGKQKLASISSAKAALKKKEGTQVSWVNRRNPSSSSDCTRLCKGGTFMEENESNGNSDPFPKEERF